MTLLCDDEEDVQDFNRKADANRPGPASRRSAPPPKPTAPNHFGRLKVLSVEDALDAPPRDYLLDGLIAPGEFSVWWGPPKCGKSFLLLRIAYGMAQGLAMWGREAVQCPVLYVAAEGGNGIKSRIHALRKKLGTAPDFHFIAQLVDLFDPEADLESLIEAVKKLGARFVVLDTLARIMGAGDENQTRDMNALVRNCQRIQEEAGAHVAVVHHGGWEGSHARGSIALIGAADIVVKISGEQGGPKTALVELAKDDASGYSLRFHLEEEELPPDAKGRPRKTYVAQEATATAATACDSPALSPQNRTGLGFLHDLLVVEGERLPPAWGMADDLRCVAMDRWEEECASRTLTNAKSPKDRKDVFNRTFKALRDRYGLVAARDGRVWATRSATGLRQAATGLRQGATACDSFDAFP